MFALFFLELSVEMRWIHNSRVLKSEQAKNPRKESAKKTDRPLLAKTENQVKSELTFKSSVKEEHDGIEKLFKSL